MWRMSATRRSPCGSSPRRTSCTTPAPSSRTCAPSATRSGRGSTAAERARSGTIGRWSKPSRPPVRTPWSRSWVGSWASWNTSPAREIRRNALQNEPLHLGILGAARIALGGIIPAATRTDAVEVAAVATRGGEKARAAREAAPGASLFEDYESLLEEAGVEAIYIPLPNSMHVEWTLRSLAAGKHILCEKPFSLEAGGADRAVEAARGAGLKLMEGFMFRLHPQTRRLKALISEGAVGEVRQAVAQFGHRLDDPADVRGVGSLGGGSLGDVGCYCVSALRLAFGD